MRRLTLLLLICLSAALSAAGQTLSGTYVFARRDTCDLRLDIY